MELNGKTLIFGTGRSGIAAAGLLKREGADLLIYDGNQELTEEKVRTLCPAFQEADIVLGTLSEEALSEVRTAVLSPGVPLDIPETTLIRSLGIKVIGEIELGYLYGGGGPVAAITGTNGKTTTTALTGALLKNFFSDVRVVGNIGIPYTEEAMTMQPDTVTVAEISSFQLETADTFHPKVSAILNITPDHLNRHHTMEAYIAAKERICTNQTPEETVVLNYEDPVLRSFGEKIPQKVCFFSSARTLSDGLFYRDGVIYAARQGVEEMLLPAKELQILGLHNVENAMAASAIALAFQVPMELIRKGLREFQAVPHRIEFVAEIRGVRYYNDSKGTNPDAAIKGITSMDRPTVLIGGGYDKGSDYTEWIREFPGRVKKLILLGQTREKIKAACDACGFSSYVLVDSFEEAVRLAAETAAPGDNVLLSPACASWGMFRDYEERGDIFRELVKKLEG